MKFNIVEIQPGDVVISTIGVGNIPSNEVNAFVGKCIPIIESVFGCRIVLLPVREGDWDFTIVRNPNRKQEKDYANTPRKRTLNRRDR
jgi:hypothetical protein